MRQHVVITLRLVLYTICVKKCSLEIYRQKQLTGKTFDPNKHGYQPAQSILEIVDEISQKRSK